MKKLFLFSLFLTWLGIMGASAQAPVAYAVLSGDGKTLTFYYDSERASRPGTTFSLNTDAMSMPEWYANRTTVNTVVFDPSFASAKPTITSQWFYNMYRITSINGMENLNTSEVTDMGNMFGNCSSLTSLDVSGFKTDNVTNMAGMFVGCWKLESLDVSHFNTAKVTDMTNMFVGCQSLKSLDVSNFNTAKVIDMNDMFDYCKSLESLDLSSFTFNGNMDTDRMMTQCTSLKSLTIPSTAGNLSSDACDGVGTETEPCTLICHEGFTPEGATQGSGYIIWKSGYFTVAYKEAYTVLSEDGKTLTFYYDIERASRPGTTYSLNTDATSMPEWYANRTTVNTVVFDPSFASARPTITSQWFYDMYRLTSINGMENLNTSEVTDMGNMFGNCSSLTSLDVSGFNTDNVTNMAGMFVGCWKLESLDVSHFNTDKVTDMFAMFMECASLTSLDVSGFNTANVTVMEGMFNDCTNLESLDVSHFNTAKVTDMYVMFGACSSLTSLDLSSFTFNGNMDTDRMMTQCTSLKSLTIPSTAGNLSSDACDGVGTETEPCTLICHEGFTPEDATQGSGYIVWKSGYFTVAYKEAYTVLSEDGKTLTFYYDIERASRPGTTFSLNKGSDTPGWSANRSTVETVVFDPSFASAEPTTTYEWFNEMSSLTSIIGMENLNTSKVTDMGFMFYFCPSLTSLDVSGFKTDNVTNMAGMFFSCLSLQSLDLSGFKTDKVTNMKWMFEYCYALTSLDVSSFKTAKVTDMGSMFNHCTSLTSLDLSSFNTANVTYMDGMFELCNSLTNLDVSGFNTANVLDMSGMFYGCSGLTSLDVSNFNTANVISMENMFSECSSLTSLDLSSFAFNTMGTSNMMKQCTSLETLTIPSTAGNLSSDACDGVGTETEPCTLICPEGFTPEGATQGSGYIFWKSGYFIVADRVEVVRISKSTYATLYYQDLNLKVPAGVTAYYVRKEGKNITLTAVGDIIPAGAPVVLHAPYVDNDGTDYKFIVTDETATTPTENDLVGSEEGGTYNDAGFKYYILSWKNADMKVEEVGFYFQSGSKGAYATVAAHQAYLKVPASQANEFGYMFEDTDAIDTVATGVLTDADAVYTLSGMRVKADNLKRGIYIVNGKKVVIK